MSVFVLQITIKQWDKSQRTQEHVKKKSAIATQHLIAFPPAFYAFDNQCVIDRHGDNLLGDRVTFSQGDNSKINFDRFRVCLDSKVLEYTADPETNNNFKTLGSIDNQWIQCKYDWRYSIYEDGFYYWLYEEVTLNVIHQSTLNENGFLNSEPASIFTA
jgi:hypothetical protein